MRILMILMLTFSSFPVKAEIVSEEIRRRINFGWRWIQESGQDTKRSERSSYQLQISEPVWERLRVETGLFYAEDNQVQPRLVRVKDDWIGLFAGAEWSHPWFFRWFAASGLIGQYERTSIQYTGEPQKVSRRESRYQAYPYLRFGLDYAINSEFEVTLELGAQNRSTSRHLDWFWGLSLGYNLR